MKSSTGQVLKYDADGHFIDYQKGYEGIDYNSSLQVFAGDDCYFYTDKMVDDKVYEISKLNTNPSKKGVFHLRKHQSYRYEFHSKYDMK